MAGQGGAVGGEGEKVAALARLNFVQQGAELAYLLSEDPDYRRVTREDLAEVGRRVRLKRNVPLLARLLQDGMDGHRFDFYVISAAPREVVLSALEGIVPPDHIIGTRFRFQRKTGQLEALEQAGMPPGVVNFLPGPGGSVGNALVAHPRTRYVAFTGSKEVGLGINEMAAKTAPGQIWIKRVIAEMGGKDSIIVDADTDLDGAAEGVAVSAFGYQGQKCSACSRAIVVDEVYDAFLEKLKRRVEQITVGPAVEPSNYMGPVINAAAKKSISEYIAIGKKEGRLLTGGGEAPGAGYFLQPTVIADVPPKARIAQEEIFGPVLAVIKAKDFDDALEIANNTEFGLTGAAYTRSREKLEKAAEYFHVGNLYLNRKCTGALVGGHPFGGFNMSGTDSKAGGFDYLLLFTQSKTIAEKVGMAK